VWALQVQKANAKKYLPCQKLTTVCLVESVCLSGDVWKREREGKGRDGKEVSGCC